MACNSHHLRTAFCLLVMTHAAPALAQEMDHSHMRHDMPEMESEPEYQAEIGTDCFKMSNISCPMIPHGAPSSGTSLLPQNEGAMHGLHSTSGDWMLMAHGSVSSQFTKSSGPRGDGKFYVTSMAMLMAERQTGFGRVQFKGMFSLEPAMDSSGYPNLFASGETSRGKPLIDRQHPHDLFMEMSARVDVNIAETSSLFLYGAPVGEPALGPSAFMHRGSAQYNPEPPITHHWFDSTHITYGVATVGLATPRWQLEGSLFTGREPDERRWNLEKLRFDSWSVRATWNPTKRWALQASYGLLKQPEFATHPDEDERRFTASVHFANGRGLTAMTAFSAKKRVPGKTLTAWLGEANWNLDAHNTLFGRVENVANDELFPDQANPLHDETFRITKFQFGYARRMPIGSFDLALGASAAVYAVPAALATDYGKNSFQYTLFARFSLAR